MMEEGASMSLKSNLAEANSKMGEVQEQDFFEDLIFSGEVEGEDENAQVVFIFGLMP